MKFHILKNNQNFTSFFGSRKSNCELVWLFSVECREKMDEILEQIPVELNKASISSIIRMFSCIHWVKHGIIIVLFSFTHILLF